MSITQDAKDFGVDTSWAVARRREFLAEEIARLKKEAEETALLFAGHGAVDRHLLLDTLKYLSRKIQCMENELKYTGKESDGRITPADIARARLYPLENLLTNIRHNKANCISGLHQDKHPSMDVRNNFVYCYSCGFRGDAIAVYMKLHNTNFIAAVKALNT